MRFIFSKFLLGFTLVASAATSAQALEGHFDFKVVDAGGGCVTITDIKGTEGFPVVGDKTVGEITLHFSDVTPGSIVVQSPRYYLTVTQDENGGFSVSPTRLCTLTGTGVRYFKSILWTSTYELIEVMPDGDFDNARHRVDIH